MPYWANEYIDETRAMHAKVLAGEALAEGFEIKLKRRDGKIFDALIIEAPLIDFQGKHTGWMGSVVDITERKHAAELTRQQEARLQASARLIAMGEMASSLAHELNQPLSAISSYTAGCRNLIATSAACAEIDGALAKCQEQAQRAGRILRRIYEFVRRHEPKSEPCDLAALLSDLITLIEPDARRLKVRIVRDLAPTLPTLQADGILLKQAILNLMRNGIESMNQTDDANRILAISAQVAAGRVSIAIGDRGCGISAESAAQLFEPFYTTKQESLGVGLNICRSVIEAHQGRLWFDAAPAGGTIFHISLPIAPSCAVDWLIWSMTTPRFATHWRGCCVRGGRESCLEVGRGVPRRLSRRHARLPRARHAHDRHDGNRAVRTLVDARLRATGHFSHRPR